MIDHVIPNADLFKSYAARGVRFCSNTSVSVYVYTYIDCPTPSSSNDVSVAALSNEEALLNITLGTPHLTLCRSGVHFPPLLSRLHITHDL